MTENSIMTRTLVLVVLGTMAMLFVLSMGAEWKDTGIRHLEGTSKKIGLIVDPEADTQEVDTTICEDFEIITSKAEFIDFLRAMRMGLCGESLEVSDGSGLGKRMLIDIYPPSRIPGSKDGLNNVGTTCTLAAEHYYYCLDTTPAKGCFVIDGYLNGWMDNSRDEQEQEHLNTWLNPNYPCETTESVIFSSSIGLAASGQSNVVTMVEGRQLLTNDGKLDAANFANNKITVNSPYSIQVRECDYAFQDSLRTGESYRQDTHAQYGNNGKVGIYCGIESYLGTSEKWCTLTKGRYLVYGIGAKNAILISLFAPPTYQDIDATTIGYLSSSKCQ